MSAQLTVRACVCVREGRLGRSTGSTEHRKTQHADTSKAQLTLTSSPAEIRINMDDRMLKAMSSLILPWRASSPRARNVAIEPAKGPLGASIPSKTGTFALVLSPHASKHVWTAVFSSASSVACAHDGRVRAPREAF